MYEKSHLRAKNKLEIVGGIQSPKGGSGKAGNQLVENSVLLEADDGEMRVRMTTVNQNLRIYCIMNKIAKDI